MDGLNKDTIRVQQNYIKAIIAQSKNSKKTREDHNSN